MASHPKSGKTAKSEATTEKVVDPATQLHEIQKLLFGQQMSQFEQVIADLKQDMGEQIKTLDKQFSQSLDKQQKAFAAQLQELNKHVESLNDQHQNKEALIEDDIDALRKSLDSFEVQTESAHNSLEQQLNEESERLSQQLSAQHNELSETMTKTTHSLDDKKLDRQSLSELLANVAKTIKA